jgi:putative ABC transport system ATP-binding protein
MDTSSPLILAKNLQRIYPLNNGQVIGLRGIDLEIEAGEFVVIKGVSGSGKSTLLSMLAGLDRPTSGDLRIAGRDLIKCGEVDLVHYRRKVVGMVFQSFNLLPTLSVLENVSLPALLLGQSPGASAEKAQELIGQLGLAHRLGHYPDQLSGGEQQRVAIARAWVNNPQIILADEPTGNLDSGNGQQVMEQLGRLNRNGGKTVVMATHSDQADPWATRNLQMRDGAFYGEI